MKKSISTSIVIVLIFILVSCNNFNKNSNKTELLNDSIQKNEDEYSGILEKINQIPITQLPLGMENLDSIKHIDYSDFGMYNLPLNYEIDRDDKYGLNAFLRKYLGLNDYDSNLKNVNLSITPVDSIELYLSKRLPPKGNKNYLLCKILQYRNIKENPFTGWVLFTFQNQDIVDDLQIGQSLTSEEKFRYALFYIDRNFNITVNTYSTCYYSPIPSSIAYLSAKQHYALSEEDNSIYLQDEGYVESENGCSDDYEVATD